MIQSKQFTWLSSRYQTFHEWSSTLGRFLLPLLYSMRPRPAILTFIVVVQWRWFSFVCLIAVTCTWTCSAFIVTDSIGIMWIMCLLFHRPDLKIKWNIMVNGPIEGTAIEIQRNPAPKKDRHWVGRTNWGKQHWSRQRQKPAASERCWQQLRGPAAAKHAHNDWKYWQQYKRPAQIDTTEADGSSHVAKLIEPDGRTPEHATPSRKRRSEAAERMSTWVRTK